MNQLDFDEVLALKPQNIDLNKYLKNFNIVLYGAGISCHNFIEWLKSKGFSPIAICDSYKVGEKFGEYVISDFCDILKKHKNIKVIISAFRCYNEIRRFLLKYIDEKDIIFSENEVNISYLPNHQEEYKKFAEENINELEKVYQIFEDDKSRQAFINILKGRITGNNEFFSSCYTENQYFAEGVIKLGEEESFIDGGGFTGDSIAEFIKHSENKFNKIYSFEPDRENYKKLLKSYENDNRIIAYNAGLFYCNKKIGFTNDMENLSNTINENFNDINSIEAVAIDNIIDDRVTFIKMDVEGSELDALKGAKAIILKYKPKLAICVYHKNEDIIEIPNFINELGLGYKFYLRHHSEGYYETVFYAV